MYNPDIHHRQSMRLRNFDYSAEGAYFVTICTRERECLFGDIVHGAMVLNEAGRIIAETWQTLPDRFPQVVLGEHVIMPNHLHCIVCIVGAPLAAPDGENPDSKQGAASSAPTLGKIIRAFKSISAIEVNRILERNGQPLWQRNYYERIVRSDKELNAIREYIRNNPDNWKNDEDFRP